MAISFRLVDHAEFDRYAAHMLRRFGFVNTEHLHCLICFKKAEPPNNDGSAFL